MSRKGKSLHRPRQHNHQSWFPSPHGSDRNIEPAKASRCQTDGTREIQLQTPRRTVNWAPGGKQVARLPWMHLFHQKQYIRGHQSPEVSPPDHRNRLPAERWSQKQTGHPGWNHSRPATSGGPSRLPKVPGARGIQPIPSPVAHKRMVCFLMFLIYGKYLVSKFSAAKDTEKSLFKIMEVVYTS